MANLPEVPIKDVLLRLKTGLRFTLSLRLLVKTIFITFKTAQLRHFYSFPSLDLMNTTF